VLYDRSPAPPNRRSLAPSPIPHAHAQAAIGCRGRAQDDETLRTKVRHILLRKGYCMLEAVDGEPGLQLIETHSSGLDLVPTAIEMPNIDGLTVAERDAVAQSQEVETL